MKELNIAMVAACPFPGNRGTPSRILRMAEALSDSGHKVSVITYHFGTDTKPRRIEVHRILRNPYRTFAPGPTYTKIFMLDPLLFFKLLHVVRKNNIDLIHAHHFEGALVAYLARKLTGVKVIYDAHTTLAGELFYYNFVYPDRLAQFIEKKVPYWSDHIIAVSHELKNFFLSIGINDQKVDVIPTGVNLDLFDNSDPRIIRDRYQLKDHMIIMYTGSFVSFQGVDFLISAMEKVLKQHRNASLVLVGKSGKEKYERICLEKGIQANVIFAGDRPFEEIPLFLAAADIVVNPRTNCPGISQKLINYMAAQKAIVSFEGSAKLLKNRHNGIIIENENVDAMADAIIELMKNKAIREELGKNALATLIKKYDWPSLAQKTEEVYYKLMDV